MRNVPIYLCLLVAASVLPMPLASALVAQDMEPREFARLVGDSIMANKESFFVWDYGGVMVMDGLWQANETFGLPYADVIDHHLDAYLMDPASVAYKAAHGQALAFGGNIGDVTSMIPIPYLNRAASYSAGSASHHGYDNTTDLKVARFISDTYILRWPRRTAGGVVSRGGGWPGEKGGNNTFLWADDQYKSVVVPSRLASLKVTDADQPYLDFILKQVNGFSALTSDFVDLTYYHGYNSEDKKKSCCKWGRANGYAMFAKVEALHTFQLYAQINIRNAAESDMLVGMLKKHLEGVLQFQSEDGRWHQLTNDTSSFLETSSTAMFTASLARAVRQNWVNGTFKDKCKAAALKGYSGLLKTVNATGGVSGICEGTEIQTSAAGYLSRPTEYLKSGDGGLGTLLMAAVEIQQMNDYLETQK